MLLQDNTTITPTGDGRYQHNTSMIFQEGPAIDHVRNLRAANAIQQHGFSDDRLMKFNAAIPPWRVWEAENVLGFNLSDRKDFRRYLILHPEFLVSPIDSGRSGRIIVKGS